MSDQIDFQLRTEMRAGVPHYVTGQHHAFVNEGDRDAAILMYADVMGYAVVLPCQLERGSDHCMGEWFPVGVALRVSANGLSSGWQDLREGFELSADMRKALDAPEVVPDGDALFGETAKGRSILEERGR